MILKSAERFNSLRGSVRAFVNPDLLRLGAFHSVFFCALPPFPPEPAAERAFAGDGVMVLRGVHLVSRATGRAVAARLPTLSCLFGLSFFGLSLPEYVRLCREPAVLMRLSLTRLSNAASTTAALFRDRDLRGLGGGSQLSELSFRGGLMMSC